MHQAKTPGIFDNLKYKGDLKRSPFFFIMGINTEIYIPEIYSISSCINISRTGQYQQEDYKISIDPLIQFMAIQILRQEISKLDFGETSVEKLQTMLDSPENEMYNLALDIIRSKSYYAYMILANFKSSYDLSGLENVVKEYIDKNKLNIGDIR